MSLDADLGIGGLAWRLCKAADISVNGAGLQIHTALKRRGTIWLTLPGVGQVTVDGMWAADFSGGCHVYRPLDMPVVDALVERHSGA